MKKKLILWLSCLMVLFSSFECFESVYHHTWVVNSSNDTIAAIVHFNYPDTLAIVSKKHRSEYKYAVLIPPKNAEQLFYEEDHVQISVFSFADYKKVGGDFNNLYMTKPLVRYKLFSSRVKPAYFLEGAFYPADVQPFDSCFEEDWHHWELYGYTHSPLGWEGLPESEWSDWYKERYEMID